MGNAWGSTKMPHAWLHIKNENEKHAEKFSGGEP
jgi:hypothetical protein